MATTQDIAACENKFQLWLKNRKLMEKEHQVKGIRWCINHELTMKDGIHGGIIADEMGLGKTILMLGIMVANFQHTGTIVVVPPSLLEQWRKEIHRLIGIEPAVYHGKTLKSVRAQLKNGEVPEILLTTYGIVQSRKDDSPLFTPTWGRMICDEAHHTRNGGKLFQKITKVKAGIRWLVTGTPIQNRSRDLLALCVILGLKPAFEAQPAETKNIILRHCLRRTKTSIGIKLPPVKYHNVNVEWRSEEEKSFAMDVHSQLGFPQVSGRNVNRVMDFLAGDSPLAWLTRMRQVCIFPHLLQKQVEQLIDDGVIEEDCAIRNIRTISKISSVVEKLLERKHNDRRKLVFSHYHGEIDVIKALLEQKGVSVAVIDGRQKAKDKKRITEKAVTKMQFASICKATRKIANAGLYSRIMDYVAPQVCICQILTTSEGLNLQHFQEIYFTSPWWNPALEDQAIARAHRIGQDQHVDVFRFAMDGFGGNSQSLDQYCLTVQQTKRDIVKEFGFN